MFPTWWRKWFNRSSRRAQRNRTAARPRRPWLYLELLEDRLTPATHTWTGASGVDLNWSTAANWTGGAPTVGESNVILNFGPVANAMKATVDDIPGDLAIDQISVADTGYSFSATAGSSITLNGGAASPTVSDTVGGNTFDATLPISLGGFGDSTFQVTTGTDTVNSLLSGSKGLSLSGAGTLVLGAANTYQGPTVVQSGTLQNAVANAVPAGNFLKVDAGAVYDLNGFDQQVPVIINTAATSAITNSSATAATLIVGAPATILDTYGGLLSGNLALTVNMSHPGKLILSQANTYTGPTTVMAGTLQVDGSITSNVTNSGTLQGSGTITGDVSGGGTFSPGDAPGAMTIQGNFTPTGTVNFEVDSPYATAGTDYDQYHVSGAVDLSGASLIFTNTNDATAPATSSVLTLIDNTSAGATTASTNPADGSVVAVGSRKFRLFYNGGNGNDVILVENSTPAVAYVSPTFGGKVGQAIADADLGTAGNQPALFGINAFSTIGAALTAVGSSGQVIVNAGTYAEAVSVTGTQTLTVTGGAAVTVSSLATAAGTTVQIGGTSLTVGGAANTTAAGVITGGGSLIKVGSGTLTLAGADTYSGGTTVNDGALGLGAGGSLLAKSSLTVSKPGTFDLNDQAQTVGALAGDGTITNNGTSIATVTFDGGAGSSTFAGVIADHTDMASTGVTALAVAGGTLILTGANTYSGGTTVSGGTLLVENAAGSGTGSASVTVSGGTLAGTGTIAGSVTVTSGIISAGDPRVPTTGTLRIGSKLTLNGGSYQAAILAAGPAAVTSGQLSVGGNVRIQAAAQFNPVLGAGIGGFSGNLLFIKVDKGSSLSGSFGNATKNSTLNVGTTVGVFSYKGGRNGNNFALSATGPVSEPLGDGDYTLTTDGDNAQLFQGADLVDSEPLAAVKGYTVTRSGTGDQTLTVDFSNGNPIPNGGLTYHGKSIDNAADLGKLLFKGDANTTLASVSAQLASTGADTFTVNGNSRVVYDGVASVDSTAVSVTKLVFDLPAAAVASLQASGAANAQLTLPFATATAQLFLKPGASRSLEFDAAAGSTAAVTLGSALTLPSSLAVTTGVTLDLMGHDASVNGLTGDGTVTNTGMAAPATLTVSGGTSQFDGFIQDGASATALAVTAGTLKLTNTNSYSGGTSLSTGGTLQVGADTNLGAAGGAVTIHRGTLEATDTFSTARAITVTDAASTIATDTGATLTVQTAIGGGGSLHKAGAGVLDLSGLANTYGGPGQTTAIDGGTLRVSDDNGLGVAANTLSLTASTLQATGTFASGRSVTLNAGGGTFDTNGNGVTLSGPIDGPGGLTKDGLGILTLGGSNSYGAVPGTTIKKGTVQVSANANLGDPAGPVAIDDGTLDATAGFVSARAITLGNTSSAIQVDNGTLRLTTAGAVTGNGTLHKRGVGVLDLTPTGDNAYSGGTAVDEGTLQVSGDGNLGTGAAVGIAATLEATATFPLSAARVVTVTTPASTIQVDSGATLTVQTTIGGGGSLHKTGPGTLDLSGLTNTYGGNNQTTAIDAGTLRVNDDHNLGDLANSLSFTGSTLQATGSFTSNRNILLNGTGGTVDTNDHDVMLDVILGGTISGTGALTKDRAGILTLSGANSYTGGTFIHKGTVQISADDNLGNLAGPVGIDAAILEVTGTLAFRTGRTITLNDPASIIMVDAGQALTVTASIGGRGSLHKAGAGVLDLFNPVNTYGGSGQMTAIGGGTLRVGFDRSLGDPANTLAFTAAGATLQATGSFTSSRSIIISAPARINAGGNSVVLTGTISNGTGSDTISLTVAGGGSVELNGTVQVPLDYQSGTTLRGHGTLKSVTLESGATFAPGSPLRINGDLALRGGSVFAAEIDGIGSYSQAVVGGRVTLNNPDLQLAFGSGFILDQAADQPLFLIVTQGPAAAAGTFNDLPDDTLVSHTIAGKLGIFELSYVAGGNHRSVALTPLSQNNLFNRALFVDFDGQGALAGSTPNNAALPGIDALFPGFSGQSWSDLRAIFPTAGTSPQALAFAIFTSPLRRLVQADQVLASYNLLVTTGALRNAPPLPRVGSAEYLALVANFVRGVTQGVLVHRHLRLQSPGEAFVDLLVTVFHQGGRKFNNRAFVHALYLLLDLPARGSSRAGAHTLNGWIEQLASGQLSPRGVADGILSSDQVYQQAIQDAYGVAFHDNPAAVGGLPKPIADQVEALTLNPRTITLGNSVFLNDEFEARVLGQNVDSYVTAFTQNPVNLSQIRSR